MDTRHGTFTSEDGLELFYRSWLPDVPSVATLVFLHGHGDHCMRHEQLLSALAAAGITAHGFDMRGHGRSEGQRGHTPSWKHLLDDVTRFHKELQNIDGTAHHSGERSFLLGFSFGGLLALDFALRRPGTFHGTLAIAPAVGTVGVPAILLLLSRALSRIAPRFSMKTGMDEEGLSRVPDAVQEIVDDELSHGRATARFGAEYVRAVEALQRDAGSMSAPFVVFHGTEDKIAAPEGSVRFHRNAGSADKQIVLYNDAYHELDHDEGAEQLMADIVSWIRTRTDS